MINLSSNTLLDRLASWKNSVPINTKDYRYRGHSTIYSSTSANDGFNPCERQVLVYRFLHRKFAGRYFKICVKKYGNLKKENDSDGFIRFACIISINYENNMGAGLIRVRYVLANTLSVETLRLEVNSDILIEDITATRFNEICRLFTINELE